MEEENKGKEVVDPRQSSIGKEPKTLTADEMQHVKEVVVDAFQSMDRAQAMDALGQQEHKAPQGEKCTAPPSK